MADRIVKVILRGDIGDLRGKMTVAAKSVGDVADKMTAASKESDKLRRGLDTLGSGAGKIGLAAAAGLGAILATAANFDSAMSRVQAATHESTANMEKLRQASLEAGAKTVFSASQAADAVTALAKAGVATNDVLHGGLNGALSLASAGELDVAQAAEIAATAMTQFGLAGKDIPHIADLLAAGAGKAQGEVTDMAAALKYVGPVAHQMGISIEQTTGAIAELASQGIIGEQAGTSLRGMLTALTSPSQQAGDTMKQLGINLYDAAGNFVGLDGVAGQLQKTMSGLTNAERDQALGRIFGNEQITAARILYAGGAADVQKWTTAVNDQGFAAETASIKMNNLKGDLENLKGSLETAFINAGEGSQGPLRTMTQGLTKLVNAFNDLPRPVQSSVTALLGLTAVTGGAAWFGSKVIRGVADTRAALATLRESSERAGAAITATGKAARAAFKGTLITGAIFAIGDALDAVFNKRLDGSNLDRSLKALSSGQVSGELRRIFGNDLQNIGGDIADAVSFMNSPGWAQGLANLGGVGDLIAGGAAAAHDNVSKLDDALAQLVENGQQDQAAQLFQKIADAAKEQGTSIEFTRQAFEQYQLALENTQPLTNKFALTGSFVADALHQAGIGAQHAAGHTRGLATVDKEAAKQAEKLRKEVVQQATALGGLGDKLNDTKTSFQGWVKDLEKRGQAIRDFNKNLRAAQDKHIDGSLIQEFVNDGESGMMRLNQLVHATPGEIQRTLDAWRAEQKAVGDNVKTVNDLHDSIRRAQQKAEERHEMKVAFDKAKHDLQVITDMLHGIPPKVPVKISVGWSIQKPPGALAQAGVLDFNHDGKPDFATGGYTGDGGKYDVAGTVHKGEYVFSKEATQGNLAVLDALHRQLRGYSSGGYVSGGSTTVGIDYDRLASAMSRMRPVQHMWSGNYDDFRRAEALSSQRAALTGVF